MRKPVIAANWKMNKSHLDAIHFVEALRNHLEPVTYDQVDIVICPPFTAIRSVQTTIDGDDLEISIGAQDMHWESSGAFTGEISASMLTKLGVKYVIIGHSERRQSFAETDETVNKKVTAAFESGLIPIMCVGETLEEREGSVAQERVSAQVLEGTKGLTGEQVAKMVIAYEPIWAIGTGKTASSEDAQAMSSFIRTTVRDFAPDSADDLRVQYGGSVKPGNIAELMSQPDIDGALVGGASLEAEDFARLVQYQK
ncbi:MAG: triose-phosphate isomerase [Actinomycetota bacterium]|nr:triose-phosphate isomerase [Actinomycetota bacterium]